MINLRKVWKERKAEKPARSRKNGVIQNAMLNNEGVVHASLHARMKERGTKNGTIVNMVQTRAKEAYKAFKNRMRS